MEDGFFFSWTAKLPLVHGVEGRKVTQATSFKNKEFQNMKT